MPNMLEQFKAARKAGCAIVGIKTADSDATVQSIVNITNTPVVQWDCVRGLVARNPAGIALLKTAGVGPDNKLNDPSWAVLEFAQNLPEKTVLVILNAHLFMGEREYQQAVWNLRDTFKTDFRTLVLTYPDCELPLTLEKDVIVLDEALPTSEELEAIVTDLYDGTREKYKSMPTLPPASISSALDALSGLAHYPAETVTAMSLSKDGLDLNAMWAQKKQKINSTRGLSYWDGNDSFEDMAGNEHVIDYMKMLSEGNEEFAFYLIADEVEKGFAGAGTDTSGSTTKQLGTTCTWFENNRIPAVGFIGAPGAGKSQIGKCISTYTHKPCLFWSFADMEGSHVGDTNMHTTNCLKVIDAMRQGKKVLVIATSNNWNAIPGELQRRLSSRGTFFFDLPTDAECRAIWPIYIKKYGIAGKNAVLPDYTGWTGAEIKNCCELAWSLNCSLSKASQFIVPVSRSKREQIEMLRQQASGRYISAAKPGTYEYEGQMNAVPVIGKQTRAIE